MWRKFDVFMAEADSGEGGGAGAGTAGAGTAPAYGGQVQGQAVSIPEKYQVRTEGGALDLEASSLKLAEAYGNLEKRLGTGNLPPKTAEEYEVPIPDSIKDQWDPKEDQVLDAFLKDAHAAGLNQDQLDFVLGKYFEIAPELIGGAKQLSVDACVADLKQEWKTDEQYNAEVRKAFNAAQAFGDKDAQGIINDYGNDPRIVRLLARVGAEIGEDRSINTGGSLPGGQSVESLMGSEAYTNPKHADHARVSAQVQAHFNRNFKE